MEKIDMGNNEVYDMIRKIHLDVNNQINKIRNIFKNKFNLNANDRKDIFLDDDFLENLYKFIETQNDLLIVRS